MSSADPATITRLTNEAHASLPQPGSADAILVVFDRTRSAWSLLIGPPISTVAQLSDFDEAIQLNVNAQMSRAEVQAQVEKSVNDIAHVVTTIKP